jgi:8-oxo-dGTP pyrophosphatase MutT (NUDIX family)
VARGGQQTIPRPDGWQLGTPNPWMDRRDEQWRYDPSWIEQVLSNVNATNAQHHQVELPTTPVRPPFVNSTKQSAVLAPLFVRDGELRVVLTRRDARLRNHRGEVAFPGGRLNDGEFSVDAALRETHEEVGLPPERVRILGQLEKLTTMISDAAITPFVGFVDGELPLLTPNPGEVDRIFDVSVYELTDPDCYHEEIWNFPDGTFPIWFFDVEDDTVWGATGRMLRRLLDLTLLTDP